MKTRSSFFIAFSALIVMTWAAALLLLDTAPNPSSEEPLPTLAFINNTNISHNDIMTAIPTDVPSDTYASTAAEDTAADNERTDQQVVFDVPQDTDSPIEVNAAQATVIEHLGHAVLPVTNTGAPRAFLLETRDENSARPVLVTTDPAEATVQDTEADEQQVVSVAMQPRACAPVSFTIADGDIAGLIAAINAANDETCHPGEDTIILANNGTYRFTTPNNTDEYGVNALPVVNSQIIIYGNGAVIERDTDTEYFRFLLVSESGELEINDLTLQYGEVRNDTAPVFGGAILNNGTLAINNCTLISNKALGNTGTSRYGWGGAIYTTGDVLLNTVMFLDNRASAEGGVLYSTGAYIVVQHNMIADNRADIGAVFSILDGELRVEDSTIHRNYAHSGSVLHVRNSNETATVEIERSLILNNEAYIDLAHAEPIIWSTSDSPDSEYPKIYINNSTISHHIEQRNVLISSVGTLDIKHSTIVENSGGILFNGVSSSLGYTILGDNENGNCETGSLPLHSEGYNISDDDSCGFSATGDMNNTEPILQALADNGGPTQTHALQGLSPALDAIPPGVCAEIVDQRGVARPQNANCDIGALELEEIAICPTVDFTIADGDVAGLIAAIEAAHLEQCYPGEDTITLATDGTYTFTNYSMAGDYGMTALPYISTDVIIEGNGSTFIRIGSNYFRFFYVAELAELSVYGVTFDNGHPFENEGAYTQAGGAILNMGTLSVTDSKFQNNEAFYGGVIYSTGTATIANTRFSNNAGTKKPLNPADTIISSVGDLTISQSVFDNNSGIVVSHNVGSLAIDASTFEWNAGKSTIYVGSSSSNHLNGNLFRNNNAVFVIDAYPNYHVPLIITNNTFSGNYHPNNDGLSFTAPYLINGYGSLDVRFNTFAFNQMGVLMAHENGAKFTANIIAYNNGDDCYRYPGVLVESGGYNRRSDNTCNLKGVGDGVRDENLGPLSDNGGPTLTYALLPGSSAIGVVPAAECSEATDQRGVSRPQGEFCDAGAVEHEEHYAVCPTSFNIPNGDEEAFIAAIHAANDETCHPGVDTITLSGLFGFHTPDNIGEYGGNALPVIETDIIIEGGELYIGIGDGSSRFFYVSPDGSLTLNHVELRNGEISANYGEGGLKAAGGAILNAGTLIVNYSEFILNEATGYGDTGSGGAIKNLGTAFISHSTFEKNLSDYGGAISNEGTITLQDCIIIANGAPVGAAFHQTGGIFTIEDSTITFNSSVTAAVLSAEDSSTTTFNRSLITKNGGENTLVVSSDTVNDPNTVLNIINSTISGNAGSGYAIQSSGQTNIQFSTISDNEIGGIDLYSTHNTITASILSGNAEDNCIFSEYDTGLFGTLTSNGYNISDDATCNFAASGDLNSTDPLLDVLADNGGHTQTHALQSGSPALDVVPAGSCTVSVDQRNASRPADLCDIGSYEAENIAPPITTIPAAASNLQASNITTNSVDLTWDDNSNYETGFRIRKSRDNYYWPVVAEVDANITLYTVTGLSCGTRYYFRVFALNDLGVSDESNTVSLTTTPCEPPAAPSNLHVTQLGLNTITVVWTDNSDDETGFVIESSPHGHWYARTVGPNITGYNLYTYCSHLVGFRVKAFNDYGESAYSETISVITNTCLPPDLQASNIQSDSVVLSWTREPSDAISDIVERSIDGNNWDLLATIDHIYKTYTDTGLACNTTYSYRVKSTHSGGDSNYSNIVTVATGGCPSPLPPSNLQAATNPYGIIILTWTDNSNNETAFTVESSLNSINWSEDVTVGANVTSYNDTSVQCQSTHYYRVRAENNGAYSPYSDVISIMSVCPPVAPSDLQITSTGRNSIALSWTDNATDESAYYVEHSTNGVDWAVVSSPLAADSTTFTHEELTCGTDHYYRVNAFREFDVVHSDPSNVVNDTTDACPTLTKPDTPTQGVTTRTSADVEWNNDFSDETFAVFVERSLDGADWQMLAELPPTADSFSDTILICGTSYQYRIRAYREEDDSYSPYSDVLILSTDACPVAVTNTMGLYKDGIWMFRDSNDSGVLDVHFLFGPQQPGWTPLIGDWNGDGVDGIGLYKDGIWIFRNSSDTGPLDIVINFAMPGEGWLPIVGDWNGDDIDTPALYKAGTVAIKNNTMSGSADARYIYGPQETGWLPIAGDWNGSGTDTLAYYKAGQWIIYNGFTNSSYTTRFNYGPAEAGWIPLAGDWDQNLSDTIGLYKGGNWRLRNSNNSGTVDLGFTFGTQTPGWQPVASYRGAASGLSVMGMAPINPLAEPVTDPTVEPTLETSTPVPTVTNQPEITPEPTLPTETSEPTATDLPEVTPEPTLPPATPEPTLEVSPTTEPTAEPTEITTTPVPETTDEFMGE